jgi:hypothetical protein
VRPGLAVHRLTQCVLDGPYVQLALRSGRPFFRCGDGEAAMDRVLPEGEWVHLAGRCNGSHCALLVNGRQASPPLAAWLGRSGEAASHTFVAQLGVGGRVLKGRLLHSFVGALQELRLWSRALSDAELQLNLGRGLGGQPWAAVAGALSGSQAQGQGQRAGSGRARGAAVVV